MKTLPRESSTVLPSKVRGLGSSLPGTLALGVMMGLVAGSANAAPKDFVVFVDRATSQYVDIPPKGPSVGDIRVNTQNVRRSINGELIGTSIARLITVQRDVPGGDEVRDVAIQYTLPGGTISLTSMHAFPAGALYPERAVRAIVGGTGKYAGARGTSTFDPIDGDQAVIIFDFTP